ncbi:hypothetical protein KEM56_004513 [Ascosphaera pollenicola]|nr:hypothetical protein KEM56_004513 [Ascosphaera pollenicola]
MAIDVQSKDTVGCCYYTSDDQTLYLFEDITSGGDDMIEKNRQFELPYVLDVRPCQDFNVQAATSQLVALQSTLSKSVARFLVPSDSCTSGGMLSNADIGLTDQQGKVLALSGFIDTDNHVSIGCAGALLTYLQKKQCSLRITGNSNQQETYAIKAIEMLSLNNTLFLNQDTLASLQIIQAESHPNTFNQGPTQAAAGSKESLSLFGLFYHFARTPQGKQRLRQLFLRPSTDLALIRQRHEFISTFLKPDNAVSFEKLSKSMKGIKNLKPVMTHLRKGVAPGKQFTGFKSGVWATLMEARTIQSIFAYHTIDIEETLKCILGGEHLDLVKKVDLTASSEEGRTVVNHGVDPGLDKLKHFYSGLESLLSQVAIEIATTLPEYARSDVNVIYFPQLGFNIAIALHDGSPVYDGTNAGWEKTFVTENRAYFKDGRMRDMDTRLGDIYGHICEKEIEITYDLAQQVLKNEAMLLEASEACGELDSVLALVHGAKLYKLSRPRMMEENILDIKGGRHLLCESTVSSFVPNDTHLVGGKGDTLNLRSSQSSERSSSQTGHQGPSMLLLTGPNYSGKIQVASIVFLAHVGSFVPADSASIGLTDKILTRVTTRETVTKMKSSFMLDLEQISIALNLATHRSLLIVDEFGKGTESSDGAGLACGLFEYLLSLGDERPKVLGATHFHEIFEAGFLAPRPELAFGHMEVHIDPTTIDLENQVTYLYNLQPGRSKVSFGINCAAMNGIDQEILQRAQELTELAANGEDLTAVCAKLSREDLVQLKEAEEVARKFLSTAFQNELDSRSGKALKERLEEVLDLAVTTSYTSNLTSLPDETSFDETSTVETITNAEVATDEDFDMTFSARADSSEILSDVS